MRLNISLSRVNKYDYRLRTSMTSRPRSTQQIPHKIGVNMTVAGVFIA
jgi:hypothetical protein